jgi:hypothetical protein
MAAWNRVNDGCLSSCHRGIFWKNFCIASKLGRKAEEVSDGEQGK